MEEFLYYIMTYAARLKRHNANWVFAEVTQEKSLLFLRQTLYSDIIFKEVFLHAIIGTRVWTHEHFDRWKGDIIREIRCCFR